MGDVADEKTRMGKRLTTLRMNADLQQRELAERLTARGYPYTYNAISNWERGTNSIPLHLVGFSNALADSLGISTKSLFSHLGYFDANGDVFTPFEMELIHAVREHDQQKIIEAAARMGNRK